MLLCGQPPYNGEVGKLLNAAVSKGDLKFGGPIWDRVSSQAKELISRMLCQQKDRLGAVDALNHSYFDLV